MSIKVIPVGNNAHLMAVQDHKTPGVVIFRDSLQLGFNIILDVCKVRKSLVLQG